MRQIRLLVPDLPSHAELTPYLRRIDEARWYTNFGPLVRALEMRLAAGFSAVHGTPGVVSVANATLGLEAALLAMRLPMRSRVLVPALTFVASAAAIVRTGYQPVFCDVDERSWLLTPAIAHRVAKEARAGAVMPVAAYGCAVDVEEWDRFSSESGVAVLIDAAGAYGNQTRAGRTCAIFSLHATKSLGAGEGGFAVSTDGRLLEEIRRISNFGIDPATGELPSVGTNAKLSEYHAAVALAALDRWTESRDRRQAVHRRYMEALGNRRLGVQLQQRPPDGTYSIFPLLLPANARAERVEKRLAAGGIETRRWYCPTLNHRAAFRDAPVAGSLRVSQALNERLLALPFHPFLASGDVDHVCDALAVALEAR